jgi:hypothetical protein
MKNAPTAHKSEMKKAPQTETQEEELLPAWMARCNVDGPCPLWSAKYPKNAEPKKHFHCTKPVCFSRGLLQDEQPFTCTYPSDAKRHTETHEKHETKNEAESKSLWTFLHETSKTLHREVRTKNQTPFRVDIDASPPDSPVPEGSTNWESRLFIGKVGNTAKALLKTIAQFGTNPGPQSIVTSPRPHMTLKEIPLPGHTILFHPPANSSETWFGVCCSDIYEVQVFENKGPGCLVQWFDKSHEGTWMGEPANFYELLDIREPQLLRSMKYSGHVLVYDTSTHLFVSPQNIPEHNSYLEAYTGDHAKDMLARAEDLYTSDTDTRFVREDRAMLEALFKTETLHFVNDDGTPVNPTRCTPSSIGCKWGERYTRGFSRIPVITSNGPVFIYKVRYRCTAHRHTVEAGTTEMQGDMKLNLEYHRLGDMRYEVTLMTELQASYVDCLTIAKCRRQILDRWLSEALKRMISVKELQVQMGYGTRNLMKAGRMLLLLHDHLPSDKCLKSLVLAMYQTIVKPNMQAYNEAVAAFDGAQMKVDGTFKFATTVLAQETVLVRKMHRRVYRTVAGAVLVAIGLEGLCLADPKLVPWENSASIKKFVTQIMRCRRRFLGSLSAPAAVTTDHIRQHKKTIWDAICEVFPELAAAFYAQRALGKVVIPVLMLQDIEHRLWKFTKKVAGPRATSKTHPDYRDYEATMKDVFHQLRVSPDDPEENLNAYKRRNQKWRAIRIQQLFPGSLTRRHHGIVDQHLRTGLLESDKAGAMDDDITSKTLRALGNAAMINFWEEEGLYIPRRILKRAARRLRFLEDEITALFPDHGYPDGENFSFHLRGANKFYMVVRSRARCLSIDAVVEGLSFTPTKASTKPTRKRVAKRRNRISVGQFSRDDTPQLEPGVRGIADNPLVEEAILGCEETATFQGLLGHKLIRGINTDETTVEAFNKYLNSNTRQGSIGYDIAEMRLCYQRLKWDSAVLQRIIFGDISRNRQTRTKAQSVLNLAMTVLAGTAGSKWYFPNRRIPAPTHTTPADLLEMGYKLKNGRVEWTDEEVSVFFNAIHRYKRTKTIIDNYADVYAWIGGSLLKGSRTALQVRTFAEGVFNAKKKVPTHHPPTPPPPAPSL